MDLDQPIDVFLKQLFASQRFAVLATQESGQPYTSLMAFAATHDLRSLIFATDRKTRKFEHLLANAHVAVMIDDRSNAREDIQRATAVTALGAATEVSGDERDLLEQIYLSKHPGLADFLHSTTCALIRMRVASYYVVSHFQDVQEIHFKD